MSSVDVWTMGIPTWLHFLFCCWWGDPMVKSCCACCPPRQKDTQGQEDKNLPFLSFPSSSSTQQKHCNLKLLAPIPLEILAGIDRFSPLFLPLFEAEFWANFDDNHSLKYSTVNCLQCGVREQWSCVNIKEWTSSSLLLSKQLTELPAPIFSQTLFSF